MISEINILDKTIRYSDSGNGRTIVLLHGYLESLDIWNDFTVDLAKNYRVICIDIPGHGKSENIEEEHSMEILAKRIYLTLKELKVSDSFIIGHSMGGYLTLMIHQMFPEILSGFSLFHSHPFADNEEIKKKRSREIDFVKDGKKDLIAKMNIPNAFANQNLGIFPESVQKAIDIALQTTEKGIIANLYAMMQRPDLSESLSKTKIPFLYIVGEQDNYINYNEVIPKISLPVNSLLSVLKNSGHMGFIEEKEKSLNIITQFLKKYRI